MPTQVFQFSILVDNRSLSVYLLLLVRPVYGSRDVLGHGNFVVVGVLGRDKSGDGSVTGGMQFIFTLIRIPQDMILCCSVNLDGTEPLANGSYTDMFQRPKDHAPPPRRNFQNRQNLYGVRVFWRVGNPHATRRRVRNLFGGRVFYPRNFFSLAQTHAVGGRVGGSAGAASACSDGWVDLDPQTGRAFAVVGRLVAWVGGSAGGASACHKGADG